MPYAIIKRDNCPYDIVIQADVPENTYKLAVRLMGLEISEVSKWDTEVYEKDGNFRVNDEIIIKSDSFNPDSYNKRGVSMWLTEKTAKGPITPKSEVQYFIDRALVTNSIYGFRLYDRTRNAILNELEEMEHDDKIKRLIDVINERYYNRYGFDEYGRYNTSRKDVKPPYNFFQNFDSLI
jgi:hypothetical protein